MSHDPPSEDILIQQAAEGDQDALRNLWERYRERLKRAVQLRLDHRIQARIDASDVVQEALIDATNRFSDYAQDQPVALFVWLRALTLQRLVDAERLHLRAQRRSAQREVLMYRASMPTASSESIAQRLLGEMTSPSQAVLRAELQLKVQEVLNALDPIDCEVLVLRHFEQMSNLETADALNIGKSAASKRYVQALRRLKTALAEVPGFSE